MLDLGRQWRQRVCAWQEELGKELYTPVGEVVFEGFASREILTPEEAEKHAFVPYKPGRNWGKCWEYGWFRADLTLSECCAGRRVVLFSGVDGEQLHYVNGRAAGATDREHHYLTLTTEGKAGETFHILTESYAGHGPRLEKITPCPPERRAVPDAPALQCRVSPSFIALWNEDAYQLKMDVDTLMDLLRTLPDTSLRALRVAQALDQMTHIADPELPPEERFASYRAAREALRSVLSCRNGSTAPEMRLIGQSHIDLAWLWPTEETFHKACRTYSTQLKLLEEYSDYQWLLVEPALLDMLRQRDENLWSRVKEAYSRGQIKPEGAFYVECDTMIPSGESLIRQLMEGRKWFRREFGVESQVAWLPDCFGFSGALPQIFSRMGIRFFGTQKLLRADPETSPVPYQNFIWEGIDGSEVEAHSFLRDNGEVSPFSFYRRWDLERTQKSGIDTMLHPFGYGDGGGGPTRDMVEMSLRLRDLEGVARSRYQGLREYFEEVSPRAKDHRWVGELYLTWHRGTWASQRKTKALIRKAETALHDAELTEALLGNGGDSALRQKIASAWKELMFCQFHDVAGGAGIARVHAEAEETLQGIIESLRKERKDALKRARGAGKAGKTVWNGLPWAREEFLLNEKENRYEWISAEPSGYSPLRRQLPPSDVKGTETEKGFLVENRYLRLKISREGEITSLTDSESGLPLLNPGQRMNDWRLYQNIQPVYDAWEMDSEWESRLLPGSFISRAEITRNTPECCEITVHRTFGRSSSDQVIRLFASSRRVDFDTLVDWQERHRMLKAHFESNIHTENALHETQFGYVQRPAHRSGSFAADRFEVCQQRWSALKEEDRGFALLNDGIFALSSGRGELALTLLRAPLVPDETNNRGVHHFVYSLYPFGKEGIKAAVRAGYELNSPLCLHRGTQALAGPALESPTLMLENIRRAEDGSNDLILRVYQAENCRGKGVLRLPGPGKVFFSSMDERECGRLLFAGSEAEITAEPFEILTLRVHPDEKKG